MSKKSRFPSFQELLDGAGTGAARFPFALLSALLGTIAAINSVNAEYGAASDNSEKLMMIAGLGLPLFIALVVFAEKREWKLPVALGLQLAGAVLLGAYYFSLPDDLSAPLIHPVRFLLLGVGLHFLVAFLPWLGKGQQEGFWQYNKSLFLRFLLSALYSAVTFLGLTAAVAAADYLFGMDVNSDTYSHLWFVCAILLNTWIFISGIPRDLAGLNKSVSYPVGLKYFAQYLLLPLCGLYFLILIAYEAKILVTWNLPRGWVSQLVLWFSVVGIMCQLLLHPMRLIEGSRWIQKFTKWFYRLLIPLVGMLFLAIITRISDYGFTVNRYFVVVLAIGLTVVMLYFVFSKARDIRIIPIVLCIIAFVSSFGPWSAFSVSQSVQQNRLNDLLVANEILHEGKIIDPETEPSFESRKEMSNVIGYLNEWYGVDAFDRWFDDSTLAAWDTVASYTRAGSVAEKFGFAFVTKWQKEDKRGAFLLTINSARSLDVRGYDFMLKVGSGAETDVMPYFLTDRSAVRVRLDTTTIVLEVNLGEEYDPETAARLSLSGDLAALCASSEHDTLEPDQLSFTLSSNEFDARIVFDRISGNFADDTVHIDNWSGKLLLRLK